jgi:hypothetical protein
MIFDENGSDFQSPGIKRYLVNLIKIGLKDGGFSSVKKEVRDRITLIEDCNTGMRLDMDSAMEILCKINAIQKASQGAYNYSSLEAGLKQYAERVLLYTIQSHFEKNNYNEWFEKRMEKLYW